MIVMLTGLLALSAEVSLAQAKKATKKVKKEKKVETKTEESQDSGEPEAATTTTAEYRDPHYGMAGCGAGSLVIKEDQMWPQVGSSLVNSVGCQFLVGCQSFAITSGSSNCQAGGEDSADKKMEKEVFVEVNLNSITKEAAQGDGQHLSALAEIFGCEATEARSAFAKMNQNNYSEIFSDNEAKNIVGKMVIGIKKHPVLAETCTRA